MAHSTKMGDCLETLLRLCKDAKPANAHRVEEKLKDNKTKITKMSYDERSKMQEALVQSEKNGLIIKQYLRMTNKLKRDTRIKARDVIFLTISIMKNNNEKAHDGLAHFLVKYNITEEAAKDLIEFHSCYRKDRLAGELVISSSLMLLYSTSCSVEAALACSPVVKQAAYLYLDPGLNYSEMVEDAVLIIDDIEPSNSVHEMLFYPDFLQAKAARMQASTFNKGKGCHTARESDMFHDGSFFTVRLQTSLRIINILIRSNDYRCSLHERLMETASLAIYDSVFRVGTAREQKEVGELLKHMCRHLCVNHTNDKYVELLLTLVVGLDKTEIPSHMVAGGRSTGAAALPVTRRLVVLPTATCTLGKRSIIFLCNVLKIPDVFINHAHNLCFCGSCMDQRGDQEVYTRGKPPKSYALPMGWYRFALRLPPRATALNVFETWHVAYHGTRDACILPILNTGDLMIPGDKTADDDIKPPSGHFDDDRKPDGFIVRQVFLSPSIKYSGLDVYAPKKMFQNPGKTAETLSARVGFQVRIKPSKYEVGPETVGATAKKVAIDKHIPNAQLEWSTDLRGVVLLTGILVKVE